MEVVISFDVTLVPGTTFTDLKDALADEEVMIATDEADASGAPSGLLQQTYPAGPISLGGSCAPDSDGDGIQDSVDQSPSFSSNSFVDGSTTPTTRGGILPRGDQDVCASDAPFPDGVRVESLSGGATPATVNSLCFAGTRDVSVRLAAGDCITVTCRPGPLAEVKNRCATAARGPAVGDVDVTLLTDGGQVVGTVVLPGGQTLLYDQQTLNVSAPDSNDTTLTVVPTSGDPLSLPPGGNVTPPAPTAIPAASTWGLTVFALFLLVSAKVYFSRRRTMQA
ncbi:MAG: hypothetical protein IH989_05195 [Planctomycetes bacterium]|nr:hypothetical protein [Planctomycetota bacterium]